MICDILKENTIQWSTIERAFEENKFGSSSTLIFLEDCESPTFEKIQDRYSSIFNASVAISTLQSSLDSGNASGSGTSNLFLVTTMLPVLPFATERGAVN